MKYFLAYLPPEIYGYTYYHTTLTQKSLTMNLPCTTPMSSIIENRRDKGE